MVSADAGNSIGCERVKVSVGEATEAEPLAVGREDVRIESGSGLGVAAAPAAGAGALEAAESEARSCLARVYVCSASKTEAGGGNSCSEVSMVDGARTSSLQQYHDNAKKKKKKKRYKQTKFEGAKLMDATLCSHATPQHSAHTCPNETTTTFFVHSVSAHWPHTALESAGRRRPSPRLAPSARPGLRRTPPPARSGPREPTTAWRRQHRAGRN